MTECLACPKHASVTHVTDRLFVPVGPLYFDEEDAQRRSSYDWSLNWGLTTSGTECASTAVLPTIVCFTNAASYPEVDLFLMSVETDLAGDPGQKLALAREAILRIARVIAHDISSIPRLRYAAFLDEEDVVAILVLHSQSSKRQLSFESDRIGSTLAITIDENMQRRERAVVVDSSLLRGLITWLRISS